MRASLFILLCTAPWLVALCVYDFRERRLPNVLTLSLGAAALVWRLGYGGVSLFLDGLLGGLIGALFLLVPFLLGGAGAGDVKMLTAAGCCLGLARSALLLFYTSVAGCLMAIVMLVAGRVDASRCKHWLRCLFDWRYDRKAGREKLPPKTDERVRLPFGIAIACGVWLTLLLELYSRWRASS